ncbi:MAG TPA: BrnT family toxin [Bryobacteraceae bacterium]|nr:BrnT family toxin [Bryobacteraceae bacterium]
MDFVWDRRKNRANLSRHGIDFEDAIRIFDGPTLEKVDDRFDYGEIRVYAIAVVNGLEITVIYTDVSDSEEGRTP